MDTVAKIAALRRAQEIKPISKTRLDSLKIPFLDDSWMQGPPNCSEADFGTPRLRRCPFDLAAINWNSSVPIGGGLDGYTWKVWFGEDGPYILKVFWDAEPPEFGHYYAVQRESQNVALLQMMEAAVKQATAESSPILVNANPKSKDEALANLHTFSIEGRQIQSAGVSVTAILSIPRMVKCYGWLKFNGQVLHKIPREKRPPPVDAWKLTRTLSPSKEYTAIVYEYIEEGENEPAVVEEVDRFLWLAGFGHNSSPAARNWRRGVLVDMSDIVHAGGFGWNRRAYGARKAHMILLPSPTPASYRRRPLAVAEGVPSAVPPLRPSAKKSVDIQST